MGESAEQAKAREAVIERYDVLGHPGGDALQALVELAACVCDVPYAAIDLITSTEQHRIASVGVGPSVCPGTESLCAVVLDEPPLAVPDATEDPRFSTNPWVDGTLGRARFYSSAPLVSPEGPVIGRLSVFDDTGRLLDDARLASLGQLAMRAMDALVLDRRTRELEDSLRELTETREDLRRSSEHLTLFAGQVGHDLRTPLTAVLANAELLAAEPGIAGDADLTWMVEAVNRGAHRLNDMLEEILAFARVGGAVTLADVDLSQVVGRVLGDLAPKVDAAGAVVEVGPLPTVACDAHQVYSVILNLVTNALVFTEPGVPPVIRVSAERGDLGWRVNVRDNGRGVPSDQVENVFVLFHRLDKRVEGSGIGLATVRRAIVAHGGRVGIDSTPGVGTTVWFELPDAAHPQRPG